MSRISLGRYNTDLIKGFTHIRGTGVGDVIKGDGAANEFRGEAGDDDLQGRGGNDTLEGGIGNDSLDGGDGEDVLRGGSGQDVLTGGKGNDRLVGGADADQFVFDGGFIAPTGGLTGLINNGLGAFNTDRNVIEDFTIGEDKLVLNGAVTISLTQERDLNSDGRLDTLITLTSGEQIELWDVAALTGETGLF